MGIFRLGFLIDFVSGPVASGFTSAVSLIILSSQIQSVLGIIANGNTFLEIWKQLFMKMNEARATDTVLGITCIMLLLIMRALTGYRLWTDTEDLKLRWKCVVNKTIWIFCTARNAVLVIVCCFIGYLLHSDEHGTPFRIVGTIPSGLPSIKLPPTSLSANETADGLSEGFFSIVHSMGTELIVIPLISLMESIAIAKVFGNF